jgi:hypothetical protein
MSSLIVTGFTSSIELSVLAARLTDGFGFADKGHAGLFFGAGGVGDDAGIDAGKLAGGST